MEIKDILGFERIEAQELIGHLDTLEKFSRDSRYETTLETFLTQSPQVMECLKRDTLYRLICLNTRQNSITEEQRSLYLRIQNRVKCDSTINLRNILLPDAVNYNLHFPCILVYEDGLYGANFPGEPLYIFDTREVLYNLVLDGYILPKIVQNSLGIQQKSNNQPSKHFTRDLMAQTIGHIFFFIG